MSQAKLPKPSVTTYADHEVITPPNSLRAKVSRVKDATSATDPVARAEAALAQLSGEFSTWMDEECEQLDKARREVKAKGFSTETQQALFRAAHDIKGEAATFGFPWVAALAAFDRVVRDEILTEHARFLARGLRRKAPQQRQQRLDIDVGLVGAARQHALDHPPLESHGTAGIADKAAVAHGLDRLAKRRI